MTTPVVIFELSCLSVVSLPNPFGKPHDRLLLICVLAAFLDAYYTVTCRGIDCSDSCFDLIDVLSPVAAATESLDDYLLLVKGDGIAVPASAEIQIPILPLMSGAIRAFADPLNGAKELGQIIVCFKPDRAKRPLMVSF